MTTIFIVEDDHRATRIANGLRALGLTLDRTDDGDFVIEP